MVFALAAVIALQVLGRMAAAGGILMASEPEYAEKIFGADIISIEILADEQDWQQMLDSAASEQFIAADVIVNGVKFQSVGIRPKGNSSLTQVASSDSDRYSFRLQFDEYVKDQTCFGLESLVLNNMLGDNSYMKEYISYDLMREAGVDAPCFGFADIAVNGEAWGLYLAVELYNDSYLERVYGDASGVLYNVKSMEMGGNNGDQDSGEISNFGANGGGVNRPSALPGAGPEGQGEDAGSGGALPGGQMLPDTEGVPSGAAESTPSAAAGESAGADNTSGRNAGGMGRGGSSGGTLVYTDDNSSSYSAIFGNVVGKGTESDYREVIAALRALSDGRDLETYFDVDQILRYLAAHTVVVNLDSYSSGMAQNYYLCEVDGQITVLPWDYNLAWGGFQSGSASSVINFPIDTPVSGVEMSARPLIDKLFANEAYLARYHSYLGQLIDSYFTGGKFAAKVAALDTLIAGYVERDATAFCTYAAYKTAVGALVTLGDLRAESIQGQLDGTVPSTTAGQSAEPGKLIPAGNLALSDLGSMMGGGRQNNGQFQDGQNMGDGSAAGAAAGQPAESVPADPGTDGQPADAPQEEQAPGMLPGGEGSGSRELMRQAMQIIQAAGGELTDELRQQLLDLGVTDEQIERFMSMGGAQGAPQAGGNLPGNWGVQSGGSARPGGSIAAGSGATGGIGAFWLITGAGTALLVAATALLAKFRRRF